MECISVCPDTALPNCSQDLSTLLTTAVSYYIADPAERAKLLRALPEIEKRARQRMVGPKAKPARRCPPSSAKSPNRSTASPPQPRSSSSPSSTRSPWPTRRSTPSSPRRSAKLPAPAASSPSLSAISARAAPPASPPAAITTRSRWCRRPRKSTPSTMTGTAFLDLLPDTSQKYLGLFNAANPADSKTATLRNMLMVRANYDALVAGDGACAGCGEKSVLRSIAAVTEAYMRPVFHAKSDRFVAKAADLEKNGVQAPGRTQGAQPRRVRPAPPGHRAPGPRPGRRRRSHDTKARIAAYEAEHGPITDARAGRGHRRRAAHRGLQPQEPASHRRPPRQRHERHGHGRAHRLQHRLRLHRVPTTPTPIRG